MRFARQIGRNRARAQAITAEDLRRHCVSKALSAADFTGSRSELLDLLHRGAEGTLTAAEKERLGEAFATPEAKNALKGLSVVKNMNRRDYRALFGAAIDSKGER